MQNHSIHLKLVLAAVAGFVVLAAFGVPVASNLPLLAFVVICPLMMMFMMRGMGHGGSHDKETDDINRSAHRH
jgi:hypothetical protein